MKVLFAHIVIAWFADAASCGDGDAKCEVPMRNSRQGNGNVLLQTKKTVSVEEHAKSMAHTKAEAEEYVLIGKHKRCHSKTRTTNAWGDLGHGLSEEQCKVKCTENAACKYFSIRMKTGACTSHKSCDDTQDIQGYHAWEKVTTDGPEPEPDTPMPATLVPATPVPPVTVPKACKPWCEVAHCTYKVCLDCDICQKDATPATPAPTPADAQSPTAANIMYPASKGYGPHYFTEGDEIPSWYGLKCETFCLNGAWTPTKCFWPACSGCLKTRDGKDACEVPKYVSGKKNVLLIMTDDLNVDVETYRYGHPQAYTPNIKKLSESGTRFDHAYAVHPICMPSRATFLTGIYGFNANNMFTGKYFENPLMSKSRTFVEMFKLNGYYTVGTGKIGHYEKPGMFELWGHEPNYGPLWRTDGALKSHPTVKEPLSSFGYIDSSFGRLSSAKDYITDADGKDLSKSGWTNAAKTIPWPMRYVSDDDRDPTPDELNADFAVEQLNNNVIMKHASWFLGVGFVRPHTPLHAPDKYFDYFPLEDIQLGEAYGIKAGDYEDTRFRSSRGLEMYEKSAEAYGEEEMLKLWTQAYLACVYAMDDQVGRVLTALEDNGFSDNTIVVFTSDHGWHNGQKQVLWKNTPWENSAGTPLIIKDPDIPANAVSFPVSTVDVFPTLIDLAGLELTNTLIEADGHVPDGYSLKPLMEDPSFDGFDRKGAISVIASNQWDYESARSPNQWNPKLFTMTVRFEDYRYILVGDGTEELYHNAEDPYEYKNLLFTSDMVTGKTQEVKTEAFEVLNSELSELECGPLEATDPKTCGSGSWVSCK